MSTQHTHTHTHTRAHTHTHTTHPTYIHTYIIHTTPVLTLSIGLSRNLAALRVGFGGTDSGKESTKQGDVRDGAAADGSEGVTTSVAPVGRSSRMKARNVAEEAEEAEEVPQQVSAWPACAYVDVCACVKALRLTESATGVSHLQFPW